MVEIAKYEDYEELILEMNKSFNEDFEKILPKLYFKDNLNMVHFITRIDNKIVSSVGLYEVERISPFATLKVGIVGAVSTLPEHRANGYMSNELEALIEYAKANNYDLLMLGGDRIRYSHFGFEYAGQFDTAKYSIEELELIAKKILPPYYMSDDALEEMMKIVELKMDQPCFGNAGEVRNIIESIEAVQASRTMKDFENELGSEFDLNITLDDVKHYEHENGIFFSSKQPDIFGLDWIENESVMDLVSKLKDPDIKLTASGEDDAELLERYRLATVRIEKLTEDGKSTGTGFFISKEGLIATNFHVVDGAARLLVKCNIPTSTGDDWSSIEDAKVVLADKEHDVAIIGLASRKKNCSYISLCSDGAPLPKVPSSVFMYGYPVGKQDIAFTAGQVSSINNETMHPLIEVDLSGKHGNSGSALIDVNTGKCIGIFSGASDNNPIDVIKYAWPIQHLWNLIK